MSRKRRPRLPAIAETDVLIASRRRCCLCYGLFSDAGVKPGQIAHLNGQPDDNGPDNLAYLCLLHHDEYDSTTRQRKGITIGEVKRYRNLLYEAIRLEAKEAHTLFGPAHGRPAGRVTGKYVRADPTASATIEITNVEGNRVATAGLAFCGEGRPGGAHVGQVAFEGEVVDGRLSYSLDSRQGSYSLVLEFTSDGLVARETGFSPTCGMNVTFAGQYQWREPEVPTPVLPRATTSSSAGRNDTSLAVAEARRPSDASVSAMLVRDEVEACRQLQMLMAALNQSAFWYRWAVPATEGGSAGDDAEFKQAGDKARAAFVAFEASLSMGHADLYVTVRPALENVCHGIRAEWSWRADRIFRSGDLTSYRRELVRREIATDQAIKAAQRAIDTRFDQLKEARS
jgi:hypothetical protein